MKSGNRGKILGEKPSTPLSLSRTLWG